VINVLGTTVERIVADLQTNSAGRWASVGAFMV
jgi:hypothetical protein